jgi:ESCRT-I complex subunit TSG101
MPSTSSSTNDTNDQQQQPLWIKKHLSVWKRRSSEAGVMRQKSYEKIITKAVAKGKYKNPDKARADTLSVVKCYIGLTPKYEQFVFDNGDEVNLLNVNGTIPVEYKGNTYNIPITIWLLQDYPSKPPMGYVVPTSSMQLKVSNHVDHTGKVFLPYLTAWPHPDSNLLGLIQACRVAFGELPPVFAKIGNSSSSNSTPSRRSRPPVVACEEAATEIDHERVSLVSKAEGVLKERFTEEFNKTKAELQSLHSTNQELIEGQEEIGVADAEVDAKLAQISACIDDLQIESDCIETNLQGLEDLDPEALDTDKGILNAQAPIHCQLVRAFVEDAALTDAIFSLGEGLRNGLFPTFDVYLKTVRKLSRQQFYLRATMIKCRERAGLETAESP